MSSWAVALMLAVTAVPAAALLAAPRDREPETLAHKKTWLLDYDRDACHLVGEFGEGDAKVVARFTRYQQGTGFDLALYGKRFRSFDAKTDAKIDFGLGAASSLALFGNSGDMKMAIFLSQRVDGWQWKKEGDIAPKVTPEQEAKVREMTVSIRGRPPFRLKLNSMAKPFAQMRDCTDNLVQSWGYDPKVQADLLRNVRPANNPGNWMNSSDYPVTALWGGHNGLVQFRLDVDTAGAIQGCHVLARTSPDLFADITCKGISKRAKLQPALDASGKPVRAYYVQKVRWNAGPD